MNKLHFTAASLLTATFLSTPALADDVDADYLNSLTGNKISWSDSEGTAVTIGEKTFYYTYNKPDDYTETSTRINNTLATADVNNKVFTNISGPADGGAIYSKGTNISDLDINSDFVNNSSSATSSTTAYGAGLSLRGTPISLGTISGDFVGNTTSSATGSVVGPAIYFDSTSSAAATIDTIEGNFVNNYGHSTGASGKFIHGGAIDNHATINNINANFIGNRAKSQNSYVWGGAINNTSQASASDAFSGVIGTLSGTFIGNTAESTNNYASGGAIYNANSIDSIVDSDFISNHSLSTNIDASAGAIYNSGSIGDISGNFTGNYVQTISAGASASGGAIVSNSDSAINNITGNFTGNYSLGDYANGGSLYIGGADIGSITGDFIGNYAQGDSGAYGGAITSDNNSKIDRLVGNFIENHASSTSSSAYGGAIFIDRGTVNIINSNFINNYVEGDDDSKGGAIFSEYTDILISADNGASLFDGNKVNGKNNAIYMQGQPEIECEDCETYEPEQPANLNLSAVNNGTITFNDGIDGRIYNVNISGDGTGVVKFNNLVENVTNFTLGANSITHLGLKSKVFTQNMTTSNSAGAGSSPIITVDVEVDKANNKVNTGQIYVDGDVEGEYRVLVNSLNPDVLDNKDDAIVPFLFAPYDDTETSSRFAVARVIGSPYMWDGSINAKGEDAGSTWYLNLTDEENPDYVPPEPDPEPEPQPKPEKIYAPEVVAGIGLHEAAIEQTRSVVRNVNNKVAAGRELCPGCGVYDYGWNGEKLHNVWVLAQGESADIEKPVDMEAKIWGIEGGFDIQNDPHNTLGVFASYRKGDYDLSGKGDKFRSNIGSSIEIDSYLAGLYYRYDRYLVWAFATLYGGVQQADVKTDDGIAKFSTDGVEFGASIEIGRTIPLANDLLLDPSVGIYYTQVNFDDADDNVGKHYEWEDIKHLEAELGAKLEKQFDNAKVYIKPSVIRTFTNGDSVMITGMNKASTYSDQTLGRVEIGGRYGFTDALSGYAWANYTFGSSYDAIALGAGLNYAW